MIFPTEQFLETGVPLTFYDVYVQYFMKNFQQEFVKNYPYDISVVTDDKPFFYKYYKLSEFNLRNIGLDRHNDTGTIIFLTQFLILFQAIFFILVFIFLPLFFFKRQTLDGLPRSYLVPFLTYFSCLGFAYMLLEIAFMQRFTLFLGSPIHSISTTLAALLISTGLGSLFLSSLQNAFPVRKILIGGGLILTLALGLLIFSGTHVLEIFMAEPFWVRVLITCLILLPIGISLGVFLPIGLKVY